MLPPHLQTPREVTLHYNAVYDSLISSGQALPFIYPWAAAGAFAVIAYLLLDHRQHPWTRHVVYATLVVFQVWCIRWTRAVHPAAAFGVGLLSAWGLLWVFAVMVANDCQTDFRRLERQAHDYGVAVNGAVGNGSTLKGTVEAPSEPQSAKLYWQPYPSSLPARLEWIADVFCSFRGVGWTFQTSGVPRLPKQIEAQLHSGIDPSDQAEDVTVSRTGIRRFADRKQLWRCCVRDLIVGYFMLDLVKTLMARDRYFIGYMDAAAPSHLPLLFRQSPILTKSYRLILSLTGVYFALREIFTLGPFFFCFILGPQWIGLRGEAWMNPMDMFGTFSNILDNGLAGWWGGLWHQVFRFGFEAPTNLLLSMLGVEKRSQTGKMTSLFAAFVLSGCLHACGSYTQLGDTRPIRGAFLFFLLQPFAILTQITLSGLLNRIGILRSMPKPVRQAFNFVLVHTWLYITAPLLMDDFAKGGVWLYEPVMFSPLRWFGYGAKDDGLFCWWNGIAWWRTGKNWWDTGIAL